MKKLLNQFSELPSFPVYSNTDIKQNLDEYNTLIKVNFVFIFHISVIMSTWQTNEFILYNFSQRRNDLKDPVVRKYHMEFDQTWLLVIYTVHFT